MDMSEAISQGLFVGIGIFAICFNCTTILMSNKNVKVDSMKLGEQAMTNEPKWSSESVDGLI